MFQQTSSGPCTFPHFPSFPPFLPFPCCPSCCVIGIGLRARERALALGGARSQGKGRKVNTGRRWTRINKRGMCNKQESAPRRGAAARGPAQCTQLKRSAGMTQKAWAS